MRYHSCFTLQKFINDFEQKGYRLLCIIIYALLPVKVIFVANRNARWQQ